MRRLLRRPCLEITFTFTFNYLSQKKKLRPMLKFISLLCVILPPRLSDQVNLPGSDLALKYFSLHSTRNSFTCEAVILRICCNTETVKTGFQHCPLCCDRFAANKRQHCLWFIALMRDNKQRAHLLVNHHSQLNLDQVQACFLHL